MTDDTYIRRAYAAAAGRDPNQTGFLQALETLYDSLGPCLEAHPRYAALGILERLGEPERAASFPILWRDGRGRPRTARGFFVQYSTALGPCRGGLLFDPALDMALAKSLALEQTLAHSLAGLPLGGCLMGADASPAGWSDGESLRFCRAFMEGLYPLLPRPFSPAWWVGQAPRRELGYLAGCHARLAAITATPAAPSRPMGPLSFSQAAGYGLCFFARHVLRLQGSRLEDQRVAVAGAEGAGPWTGELAARMGARVTALGDESGCLWAEGGLPLSLLRSIAAQPGLPLLLWAVRAPGVEYRPGPAIWDAPADVLFLCGGVRLRADRARALASRWIAGVYEGAPRSCSVQAARLLTGAGVPYAPAIAAGAGGSLMACRQQEQSLSRWEAERTLRAAMEDISRRAWEQSAQLGRPGELAMGARAAAFRPLAEAMLAAGL